jgi:hypothetical protein
MFHHYGRIFYTKLVSSRYIYSAAFVPIRGIDKWTHTHYTDQTATPSAVATNRGVALCTTHESLTSLAENGRPVHTMCIGLFHSLTR